MKLYLWDEVSGFEGDRSTGNRFFLWETFQYLNINNDTPSNQRLQIYANASKPASRALSN